MSASPERVRFWNGISFFDRTAVRSFYKSFLERPSNSSVFYWQFSTTVQFGVSTPTQQ
ncbi:unnamed protein product [Onchocerca flexuosa]|uniref:NTF2 domain-containing protein n=1 Tax=Onchocerca flexuosa TaxID=387005 RepID=A0A183HQ60_9BILA|nr:unnamed protein product [Onchocerca flexuosa]